MTQSQSNIFSFRWKTTVTLYWNLGTSEFSIFVVFSDLWQCCPTAKSFPKVLESCWRDKLNYPMLIAVFLLLFQFEGKKSFMRKVSLYGVPKGYLIDNTRLFEKTLSEIIFILRNLIFFFEEHSVIVQNTLLTLDYLVWHSSQNIQFCFSIKI